MNSKRETEVIARTWRGRAANDKAAAYEKHFTTTVAQNLGDIEGSKGAYLLRRAVTIKLWAYRR